MKVYDYYETGDGVKVTHSELTASGVRVFFDRGNQHCEVALPQGVIVRNDGFSDAQASAFLLSAVRGRKAIFDYASNGGVAHAWAV
ncbi:hypothetical protein [Pseudoscardovia suis]